MTITIFTLNDCRHCTTAKQRLAKAGFLFNEINLSNYPERKEAMMELTGGKTTVPQIFIGEAYVGGASDLTNLSDEKLEAMVKDDSRIWDGQGTDPRLAAPEYPPQTKPPDGMNCGNGSASGQRKRGREVSAKWYAEVLQQIES